jgi:hypothetical protein
VLFRWPAVLGSDAFRALYGLIPLQLAQGLSSGCGSDVGLI